MTDLAPYPGKLKVGAKGPAVTAVQQALQDLGVKRHKTHPHEEGLRLYDPTGVFRKPTAMQCGHAQEIFHLDRTNTYGPGLHAKLGSHFNAHSRELLTELHYHAAVDAFQDELVDIFHHTAGYVLNETHRTGWTYHMDGYRMSILRGGLNIDTVTNAREDCTSYGGTAITVAARRVGLPDPAWTAGLEFWTGSMIHYGTPVSLRNARVGDRVHYGARNSHLGVVMGKVQGLLAVASFGGEPGPLPRKIDYREIYAIRRDYP